MSARTWIDRTLNRTGIGRLALALGSGRLRILCYHGLWTAPGPHFGNKLFMSPEKFEARVDLMKALGLEVLPMIDAMRLLNAGRLPPKATVITIDDGWSTTFSHMLPILERHGYPATVYVQTERIDLHAPVADVAIRYAVENTRVPTLDLTRLSTAPGSPQESIPLRTPAEKAHAFAMLEGLLAKMPVARHRDLLSELFPRFEIDMSVFERCGAFDLTDAASLGSADRKGFEIALHTHSHSLGDLSSERIAAEIARNRSSLSAILGRPADRFKHFCWPSGEYTREAIEGLRETGVEIATTCDFGLVHSGSDPLALPRLLDGQTTSDEAFLAEVSGARSSIGKVISMFKLH